VLAGIAGVMLDVGAHHGSALSAFLKRGWSVYAFEPDPANRAALTSRFGDQPGLVIDPRAVSDRVAAGVVFYASSESTGIGTLKPFRDSYRPECELATTTVQEVVEARGFTSIDFLKVDTAGYDLMVLRGVPWGRLRPRVVLCEFEDRKTGPLGYTFHDLAGYLVAQGYRVWVSEWHPVLRYGSRHAWRRLLPYPCHLGDPDASGNCIAFREAADEKALAQAARMAIERPSQTRSVPWLGLTYQRAVPKDQRGVMKVKRRARALTNRTRAGIVAYLDGHHPDASASLRAALGRLRAYRRLLNRLS
jgi:FkbM family methyltransferase